MTWSPTTLLVTSFLAPLLSCIPAQRSASAPSAAGVDAIPATSVDLVAPLEVDELAALLPSYAARQADGSIRYWVNVRITQKDMESHDAKIAAMRLALALKTGVSSDAVDKEAFAERVAGFFDEGEKLRRVDASIGGGPSATTKTNLDGIATLNFSASSPGKLTLNGAPVGDGLNVVPAQGISVVSDVDDTIKITNVLDQQELLRNTFFRPFEAVPGMAAAYKSWATKPGTTFHYVSKTPWQLYGPLRAFLAKEGFPAGTYHLKSKAFGVLDLAGFFAEPHEFKIGVISQLLADAPARTFVLVGDSGEADPEIYGELARHFGDRIGAIYVRNVTNIKDDDPRLVAAFTDVPRTKWTLFKDAAALVATPL